MLVIAISGPTCAGKTTLAGGLSSTLGLELISVRSVICELRPDAGSSRVAMQAAGRELERSTTGSWIADAVSSQPRANGVVIDAVRTVSQLNALRRRFPAKVAAVHLTASESERRERYALRKRGNRVYEDTANFEELMGHPTEAGAEALRENADIVLDTSEVDRLTLVEAALRFVRSLAYD